MAFVFQSWVLGNYSKDISPIGGENLVQQTRDFIEEHSICSLVLIQNLGHFPRQILVFLFLSYLFVFLVNYLLVING